MQKTQTTCLTEEQAKIRAWGEEQNAKVKEKIREEKLPTAQELLDEIYREEIDEWHREEALVGNL